MKLELIERIARLLIVNGSILIALAMTSSSWDGETWVVLVALGATSLTEILGVKITNK